MYAYHELNVTYASMKVKFSKIKKVYIFLRKKMIKSFGVCLCHERGEWEMGRGGPADPTMFKG